MASAYDKLIEKDEKELEELIKAEGKPVDPVPDGVVFESDPLTEKLPQKEEEEEEGTPETVEPTPEPEDPEEKTFKKRYGDLRTHTQKQKKEFEKTVAGLEDRIKSLEAEGATPSGNVEVKIPADAAALEEWRKDNPDAAKIFEDLARDIANKEISELKSQVSDLTKDNEETTAEKMVLKVSSAHQDFDDIRGDDEFHEWVEKQPKWVDTTVYESHDAAAMIQVLNLYKMEKGEPEKAKGRAKTNKEGVKSAASNVKVTSAKPEIRSETSNKIKESWVENLSLSDFDKNSDLIETAMKEGNFVYDVTGGAR